MTASIDVFLDGRCILRTGGQAKLTGSHSASFSDGGSEHRADLSWGHSRGFSFPYQLRIDGVAVDDSQVKVENWHMIGIPAFIIATLLMLLFGFLLWLMATPHNTLLESTRDGGSSSASRFTRLDPAWLRLGLG
jgi:hypothetical protein